MSLAVLSLSVAGCAATGPQVNVIGVSEAPRSSQRTAVVLFVEVVNPGPRELHLSRLDYEFESAHWVSRKGVVKLTRRVAPSSTAVVELPVAVAKTATKDGAIDFTLKGRLYGGQGSLARSWKVFAKGALSGPSGSSGAISVRMAIVAPQD